jgi:hypothetical protein
MVGSSRFVEVDDVCCRFAQDLWGFLYCPIVLGLQGCGISHASRCTTATIMWILHPRDRETFLRTLFKEELCIELTVDRTMVKIVGVTPGI